MGTLGVIEDVSERRYLDVMRRDFVANVSHELRTPVGAIGVLAETLSEEADPAVTRRLATRITAEVERAGRIIADLLDLSRIEAEGVREAKRVAISEVVEGAVDRVRAVADQRDVQLDVAPSSLELAVMGDAEQLVSAVANLLDNAVKYSEETSTVRIVAREAVGWVEIEVCDQGIGIPAQDLERVFERFYRVDPARSRQTGGTGLGLSIVRHVAINHGGKVTVHSREGEGSAFTLRIAGAR
jgi:two-component system sensor histidine kinase SenX3